MNNLKSEDIVVAIGVLRVMADEAYDKTAVEQSQRWEEICTSIYYLTREIERVAREEVQR